MNSLSHAYSTLMTLLYEMIRDSVTLARPEGNPPNQSSSAHLVTRHVCSPLPDESWISEPAAKPNICAALESRFPPRKIRERIVVLAEAAGKQARITQGQPSFWASQKEPRGRELPIFANPKRRRRTQIFRMPGINPAMKGVRTEVCFGHYSLFSWCCGC
jgi:hypothetical protein